MVTAMSPTAALRNGQVIRLQHLQVPRIKGAIRFTVEVQVQNWMKVSNMNLHLNINYTYDADMKPMDGHAQTRPSK